MARIFSHEAVKYLDLFLYACGSVFFIAGSVVAILLRSGRL
jgi:hypothetical protein